MPDLKFDLKENAIDSFRESIEKYKQGQAGDNRAYKFCVQHLSHFMELLFKYYVSEQHPLLIYKNPFATMINDESKTISLDEAINFIKNEGEVLDKQFLRDLKWMKGLRNNIEHHKFTLDIDQVKDVIGRLITSFFEFTETYTDIELVNFIEREDYDIFINIQQVYEAKLDVALKKAEDVGAELFAEAYRNGGYDSSQSVLMCHECGHETLIPEESSKTSYRCCFCYNEESDDIELACGVCGDLWTKYDMSYTIWGDDEDKIYVCPRCRRDPDFVKDD